MSIRSQLNKQGSQAYARLRANMTDPDLPIRLRHKDNCDALTFFSRLDRIDERKLHHLKWFDYRFMSPTEATYIFRSEYQNVYRRKYSTNIDTEKSLGKFGVRRGIAEDHRAEFTSFWRARQFADQLGVPYDIFLEAAFEVLLRGGWERIPYINQLYGKHRVRISVAVTDLWEEQCQSQLMFSPLPQYQEDSFHGLAAQIVHQDWVVEQLKKSHSNYALGRACFLFRILPEERAKLTFGEERLEKARACAAEEAAERPASESHTRCKLRHTLPSCMMLPDALDTSSPECSACKAARACAIGEASVLRSVIRVTGVADPKEHRRRMLGRDRTRKHREEKTKLAAEAPSA